MIRLASLLCCLALPMQAQDGDPIVPFSKNDPVMNAAIAEAQTSLPLFLCESTDADGYGPQGGLLKVAFPVVGSADDDNEIIWVGPFVAWDGKNFAGFLANQPVGLGKLNAGDQVDFTYDMIQDWVWRTESGESFGHYTTRVIMAGNTDADSVNFLAQLADPPFDPDWTCD